MLIGNVIGEVSKIIWFYGRPHIINFTFQQKEKH